MQVMGVAEDLKYQIRVLDGGMALSVMLLRLPRMISLDALTEALVEDLQRRRVAYGVDEAAIKELVRARTLGAETIIARGKPIRRGSDAEIEMLRLPPSFLPVADAEGRVDFRNIENIAQVGAGDVIARKTPMDDGDTGINIFGMTLTPPKVKDARHPAGRNTIVSEDGLEMIAAIDGYLRWNGDKIDVVDLYVVNGDVDFGTGNIHYQGSIEVRGSVRAGFEVVAGGDVTVIGVVDGGTVVSQAGTIKVGQGVLGNSEAMGVVMAAGDVNVGRARFAKIESKHGSITADYSVEHSELKAAADLTLNAGPAMSCTVEVGGQVRVAEVSEAHRPSQSARAANSQRREHVRVNLLPPIRVDIKRENPNQTVQGRIVDISGGGMRVRTQVRFKPGEQFQIQFRLPEVEGLMWLEAQALRAVDTPADRLDSRVTYAVKFLEVEPSIRDTIAKFCVAEDFRQNRLLRDAGKTTEGQAAMNRRLGHTG